MTWILNDENGEVPLHLFQIVEGKEVPPSRLFWGNNVFRFWGLNMIVTFLLLLYLSDVSLLTPLDGEDKNRNQPVPS